MQQTDSSPSLANLDKGTTLKFFATQMINGKKCATIEENGIVSKVEYWSNVVIWGVVGAKPPLDMINRFVHRIWKNMAIVEAVLASKGCTRLDSQMHMTK